MLGIQRQDEDKMKAISGAKIHLALLVASGVIDLNFPALQDLRLHAWRLSSIRR